MRGLQSIGEHCLPVAGKHKKSERQKKQAPPPVAAADTDTLAAEV